MRKGKKRKSLYTGCGNYIPSLSSRNRSTKINYMLKVATHTHIINGRN